MRIPRLPLQSLFEARDVLGNFSLRDPAFARLFGRGGSTAAGIDISEDSALNIAAYWRGVQLIAGQLAAMPFHLYRSDSKGNKDKFTSSKMYKLVHDNPNPEMTAFSFREALQAHVLTWGNAYSEIEWNNLNQPIAFWPITPDRVTVFRDKVDKKIKYLVAPNNRTVAAEDMLHIPGLGFDGLIGYSVIARARQSLGLSAASERYGATFFGNGTSTGGFLSTDKDLDPDQRKELRDDINAIHQGPDRAHKFMLLYGGLKFSPNSIPPEDAQFLQTRTFQVTEIARWLGCPPHKLFELSRSTNNNIEHQGIEFYTDTLWMWLEKWEQEFTRKLIPDLESNYQSFEFDFNGVMRADTVTRFQAYHMALEDGWANRNEVRAKENMNPIAEGGDIYQAQLNKIPLDQFREWTKTKLAPPKPAAPPAATPDPALQAAADDANQRAAALEAVVREARSQAERLTQELDTIRQQSVVDAEAFTMATRARDEAVALAEVLTGERNTAQQEAQRLSGLLEAEQARAGAQSQRADQAEAAHVAVDQARSQLESDLRVEREARQAEVTALNAQIVEAGTRVGAAAAEIEIVRASLTAAEAERDARPAPAIEATCRDLEARVLELEHGRADLQARQDELSAARDAAERARSAAEEEMERLTQESATRQQDLESQLAMVNQAIEALRQQHAGDLAAAQTAAATTAAALEAATSAHTAIETQLRAVEETSGARRQELESQFLEVSQALDALRRQQAAEIAAAQTEAGAAAAALEAAEGQRRALEVTLEERTAAARTAQAEADSARLEASAAAESVRQQHAEELATAAAALEASEALRRALEERLTEQANAVAAARTAQIEAETARLDAEHEAQSQALQLRSQLDRQIGDILESHRRLIARRLRGPVIAHEIERVQKVGHDPNKLRRFLETFYDGFRQRVQETLEEALDPHLTWAGRSDRLQATAQQLAEAYVERSKRELQSVLAGGGDTASLVHDLCERWTWTRADDIAGQIIQHEINRRLQTDGGRERPRKVKRTYERDPTTGVIISSTEIPLEEDV